jgi:deoxyribonuclease-1
MIRFATLILLISISAPALSAGFSSFEKAKDALYAKVYNKQGTTVYTGCRWYTTGGNKEVVDLESCNLQDAFPRGQLKRAKRVEAEHIIPASWAYKRNGQWRQCAIEAKQKGEKMREYCQDHDMEYRQFHNDLNGLFASVGQINGDRSNKPYAEKPSGENKKTFRGNGREITITSRVAIPPKAMRGDIARIALFYRDKYGIDINSRQEVMYRNWMTEDPVSNEERARNERVKFAQGWGNPYIK